MLGNVYIAVRCKCTCNFHCVMHRHCGIIHKKVL
jgi:hypothetical protein